ncbi:hypothetical protein [Spirosoma sp. KNUC1025]|uniref:hypothetical protein n=1 Tax=Spirosoma sp. KNUC1025 TaxID=2894082 RepID=UPI00386CA982|nr:hypothetical protein LN737_11465 [Spirosoma sp. KNUC1025]
MKKLFGVVFLFFLTAACRSDNPVDSVDLLHNRWHLYQTRRIQDVAWTIQDTDAYYDTEYRPDGTVVYRKNGAQIGGSCCAPTRYSRQGLTINYSAWNLCANAFCATLKQVTISQLTETLLEVNDGYMISQYERVD